MSRPGRPSQILLVEGGLDQFDFGYQVRDRLVYVMATDRLNFMSEGAREFVEATGGRPARGGMGGGMGGIGGMGGGMGGGMLMPGMSKAERAKQ